MKDRVYEAALKFARRRGFREKRLPQGVPESTEECPLAAATGFLVTVEDERVVLYGDDGDPVRVRAPRVIEFIKRFDNGEYPELVA